MPNSWKTFLTRFSMPFELTKGELALIAALLAVAVAGWIPRRHGPIDLRWDSGVYYVLGTSLAEGKGYRLLNEPGEIEAIQYPPLLPAIVAAHQLALGTSDPLVVGRWLRRTFFCLHIALVLATYILLRACLPAGLAFGGGILFALNIFPTFFSDECFSEIPFSLAVVAFALFRRRGGGRLWDAWAGLSAVAAFLLRTAGIAVLATWVLESLAKRQFRRAAVRTLIAAVPVLAWQGYIASVQNSKTYSAPTYEYQRAPYMFYNVSYATNLRMVDPLRPDAGEVKTGQLAARFFRLLSESPGRLAETAIAKEEYWKEFIHWRDIGSAGVQGFAEWSIYAVLIAIGMFILCGLVLLAGQRNIVIPLYIGLSLLGVCLMPWPSQIHRYWTPAVPFLVLAFLLSVKFLWDRGAARARPAARRGLRVALVLMLAAILAVQLYSQYLLFRYDHQAVRYVDRQGRRLSYRLFFYDEGYRSLDAVLDKLIQIAKPGATVGASIHMPHWVYLRTGLKTVMTPFETDVRKAQQLLDSVPVDYLVLNTGAYIDSGANYMLPVVHRYPEAWKRVYGDKRGTAMIFERTDRQSRK